MFGDPVIESVERGDLGVPLAGQFDDGGLRWWSPPLVARWPGLMPEYWIASEFRRIQRALVESGWRPGLFPARLNICNYRPVVG